MAFSELILKVCHQVASSLLASSCCIKSMKIRLDWLAWCPKTCCALLKQVESILIWTKSLHIYINLHQARWLLPADLSSSSQSKRCERILISAWWQQDNNPAADSLQFAHVWLCYRFFHNGIYIMISVQFIRDMNSRKPYQNTFKSFLSIISYTES